LISTQVAGAAARGNDLRRRRGRGIRGRSVLLRGRVVPRPCYVVGRSSLVDGTRPRRGDGGGHNVHAGGGGGKNDEFLDDEMEELLAIGGDPTFLEQARGGSGEFEWDGVEDDAAHFDDPVD
jgi:hypothetical protein